MDAVLPTLYLKEFYEPYDFYLSNNFHFCYDALYIHYVDASFFQGAPFDIFPSYLYTDF